MMNAPSPAAKPPPPPPAITSLTSHSSTKAPGTTSMSEALATTVAEFVCDNRQRTLSQNGTKSTQNAGTGRQVRVVSDEQHSPRQAHPANPSRKIGPRTVSIAPTANSNACSSMSSAVADLASGMSIFQPSTSANHGNHHGGGSGHSAPIISGTAAAVMALQSTFDAGSSDAAIVSNTSSVENAGGGVPDPLKSSADTALMGCAAVSSPTETQDNYQLHPSATSPKSPNFPTRYSDGAPIIAGTAAAQMEAISIATAARITSITNEEMGGSAASENLINAVASLGPLSASLNDSLAGGDSGLFDARGGESTSKSHGFTGWAKSALSTTGATISKRGSKALSWVDHRKGNARVTPEGAGPQGYPAYQVSVQSSSHHANGYTAQHLAAHSSMASAPAAASATTGGESPGGGMDILAEIICHAPPMSLPQASVQASQKSTISNITSYPQHPQASSSIPSYQEIYKAQGQGSHEQQQQPSSHQAQHHQVQQTTMLSPGGTRRVSTIPSYQEIYREMGLSPKRAEERSAVANSYLVEEVQVDGQTSADHGHHTRGAQQPSSSSQGNVGGKRSVSQHSQNRAPTTHFGHARRGELDGIEEGKELYTRKDLSMLGGHLHENKDVHGNMKEGCDSLVIGCLEKDIREVDGLLWFLYSTDRPNGGGALCQSYHKKRPIRIFRSSLLGGKYAPPFLDVEDDVEEDSDVAYRYDGLYMVRAVWDATGNETETFPVTGVDGWQTYFCTRIPKRPLDKEKKEPGVEYNIMGCQELWGSIQKMRGVRRPKKFEIPTPPVKLGPMKRSCITGKFKDRKCPGYVRPEPVVVAPPKPPPRPKSPPREKPKPQDEVDSDSSEEEPARNRQEVDGSADSDGSQKRASASPLSARTPTKMLNPRPRLNSLSQSPRKTPATHQEDDSSDSETSTSTSHQQQQQQVTNNRNRRKPSPSKKLLDSMGVSAYFPKRASAARAEVANREIIGVSRSNKRKSSESASSATAPASKPKQPTRPPSGRKRAKVVRRDYDDSSSSSSEPESNVVDQSILTIGSRVLVLYKGQLFKATIRKRREKNERHDFLIHYDGNKRTNVHWIPLDRISEILEINVDTPPKKKKPPVNKKAPANKKRKDNGKRKAPAKQESTVSTESNISTSKETAPLARKDSLQQSHYDSREKEEESKPVPQAQDDHDNMEVCEESIPSKETHQNEKMSSLEESGDVSPSAAEAVGEALEDVGVHKPSSNGQSLPSNAMESDNGKPVDDSNAGIDAHANDTLTEKEGTSSEGANAPVADADEEPKKSVPAAEKTAEPMDIDQSPPPAGPTDSEMNGAASTKPKPDDRGDSADKITSKKSRKTEVSDVCVAAKRKPTGKEEASTTASSVPKDPLLTLAEEAEEAEDSDVESATKDPDGNNSSGNNSLSQASSAGEPTSELKYQVGGHVYVEYRQIFYSSTILKTRRKRSATEYLVHYEGYKKSSNRWVKENTLHEVNAATTQRFEEQRLIPADILYESVQQPADFSMTTRRKKATDISEPSSSVDDNSYSASQRKPPPRRMRSDASDAALESLEAGVAFLAGSMVFVEWSGALYLAKMLKKRYSGDRMEYLISYDGFKNNHDAWVSIHKIYEVNPQTKRVFKRINSDFSGTSDDKPKRRAPPGIRRRETRKKAQDDEAAAAAAAQISKTRNNGESSQSHVPRASSRATTSSIDMQGIEPGVEFLPGSTLFAEYKGGLCLAKMLKKRGKGDYMEYFIQYNGLKKAEEAWVSTSLVYEINPQTKRMFRQLSKT